MDGAIEALRRAATEAADAPPVRLNLANALVAGGMAPRPKPNSRRWPTHFLDDWRALRELYVLLRSQAREEEALEAIEEASRRNPDALDLLLAVASQRLLLLDNKGAESAYNEVVNRDPPNASGNLGLTIVCELSNRTEDLAKLVGAAEARGASEDVVNFIRAFDHRRAKRFEEGIAAMAAVPGELETARHAQLLGQLNDGAGHYDDAWRAFSRMNEIQRSDSVPPRRAGGDVPTVAARQSRSDDAGMGPEMDRPGR